MGAGHSQIIKKNTHTPIYYPTTERAGWKFPSLNASYSRLYAFIFMTLIGHVPHNDVKPPRQKTHTHRLLLLSFFHINFIFGRVIIIWSGEASLLFFFPFWWQRDCEKHDVARNGSFKHFIFLNFMEGGRRRNGPPFYIIGNFRFFFWVCISMARVFFFFFNWMLRPRRDDWTRARRGLLE